MVRGYGRIRDAESMVSDDDNSEDDIDDTLVYIAYQRSTVRKSPIKLARMDTYDYFSFFFRRQQL